MTSEEKEENINSLCKKYFTPELCSESITESKIALKGKIWTQLVRYGTWICRKNFGKLTDEMISEKIIDIILLCWPNWEKNNKIKNYSNYFYTIVINEITKFSKSKNEIFMKNAIPFDMPVELETNSTLIEITEDKSSKIDSDNDIEIDLKIKKENALFRAENYFKTVDIWFKARVRKEWNKTLVTAELYSGLHAYFDYYPNRDVSRFSFIDKQIFLLPKEPSNKELANLLGKDEGQVSRAKKNFRKQINDLMNRGIGTNI